MEPILRFDRVELRYGSRPAVYDLSFSLRPGRILGIVGESGSGKSTTIKAAMGLPGPFAARGDIWYKGWNIPDLSQKQLQTLRGPEMAMIFQNCGAALCPIRTVGDQIYESMAQHQKCTRRESDLAASELMEKIGLNDPDRILCSYPFELSGGMNQRVGICIAMLLKPSLLFADEPTSALDVTVQAQVVQELLLLRELFGTAIVIVTHNLGVVRAMSDEVLILKDGHMVEYGQTAQVLENPQQEYTKSLLAAVPQLRRGQWNRF